MTTSTTSTTSSSSIDCDVDKDGYLSNQPPCGGDDCNDHDARVNKGVGTNWIQAVPTPVAGWITGDWNCDGVVEVEFPPNVSCPAINVSSLVGGDCTTQMGYTGAAPGCGGSSSFVQCKAPLLSLPLVCAQGTTMSQVQGCR
jgi:hypothetical protein